MLFDSLQLQRGPAWRNRFALAPLTNTQSHDDGRLSEAEARWLEMRAQGGFGLVMTCATYVHSTGRAFPGQLGLASDEHAATLAPLAQKLRDQGAVSAIQLHHGGLRCPAELVGGGQPVAPSPHEGSGARAMTTAEVEDITRAFIESAVRAEKAGFDGVELHGAHGYLLAQFLSPKYNRRDDQYGGALENRARLLFDIVAGIRDRCGPNFQLGVRLSPERFGMQMAEAKEVAEELMTSGNVDYLDMSLWDVDKRPEGEADDAPSLLSHFTGLRRGACRLGAAGKIRNAEQARRALEAGLDFVTIGRAAILHFDFPRLVEADPRFEPVATPVSPSYLESQGLSPAFVQYMRRWDGFVEDED
jgi:2,4-dienoyl-CoA reductase-like NADH-dependent reductase (Old Yellow Enzyme family)